MRKIIVILLLLAAVLVSSCAALDMGYSDFDGGSVPSASVSQGNYTAYLEGYYLLAKDGSHMIIGDNQGPCVMIAESEVSFDGLTDGDRIRVKASDILESYPGQLTAYSLEKLSDGEYSDIDEQTLNQLAELGWIKK